MAMQVFQQLWERLRFYWNYSQENSERIERDIERMSGEVKREAGKLCEKINPDHITGDCDKCIMQQTCPPLIQQILNTHEQI